jgi:hypothetical protein
MAFALKYRAPIDSITADKSMKNLRKFELDDDEWSVIQELVSILKVSLIVVMNPSGS